MKRLILIGLLASACGSSPTAPTPAPVIPPAPTMITITGHVSATNGGQPLGGLSAALGATTAMTDGGGSFTASMSPTASLSLALTGVSIVPRTIRIAAMNTRDVSADAITLGGGFDLDFYRKFARNGAESTTPLALRHLPKAPLVYVRTVDENGQAITAATLKTAIDAVWSVGSAWTGGRFGIADVPSGTDDHTGEPGWLTIKWRDLSAQTCGTSNVGVDGGFIELGTTANCACNGSKVAPSTVRHELGHAFGFWHTKDSADLMSGDGSTCNQQPSARELYHARIAYSRPVGNVDPDNDNGPVYLAPLRVP